MIAVRHLCMLLVLLGLPLSGSAQDALRTPTPQTVQPRPLVVAQEGSNASCISACRAAFNQCRMATKDSPTCASRQDACLRACLARR
jgi:hypothetical protein